MKMKKSFCLGQRAFATSILDGNTWILLLWPKLQSYTEKILMTFSKPFSFSAAMEVLKPDKKDVLSLNYDD